MIMIEPSPSSSNTVMRRALMVEALPLLLVSVYVQYRTAGDAGAKDWLLYAARMMLSGKKLYVDIFEVNPPFIVWFDALPVWLSMHMPFLSDGHILVLMGFAVVGLCIALSMRLMRVHPAFADDVWKRRWFGLLLAFVFVFFTSPVYFFDREHIMLLFLFPYILRFMPSLADRPLSLPMRGIIGCMAALGFCTKPHTLLVFVTLQALYILRRRSFAILWSLENILIYIGGAIYLVCAWYFAREYFTVVMPIAMLTYGMYSKPKADYIYFVFPVIVILALTFVDFRRHASPFRKDIPYFLGVCAAFLLYALANNGWGYTFNPLISATLILSGWVWMEYRYLKGVHSGQGLPVKQFTFGARSCAIVFSVGAAFFALCFSSYFFTFDCNQDDACKTNSALLEQARKFPRHSFGVTPLDPTLWVNLSHMANARWDTRFNAVFMLPSFMMGKTEFNRKNHWVLDYVSRGYAEDMERWKPDTMFVDDSPQLFSNFPNTDLIAFLSFTPEFRKAWSPYHRVATVDVCHEPGPGESQDKAIRVGCRYAVYQRADTP